MKETRWPSNIAWILQIDIYAEIENLKRKNANLAAQKKSLSDMIIQQPNVQIPAHIRPLLDCGQQPNEQIPAQIGQLVTPQIQHPSFSAPVAGFPRVSVQSQTQSYLPSFCYFRDRYELIFFLVFGHFHMIAFNPQLFFTYY